MVTPYGPIGDFVGRVFEGVCLMLQAIQKFFPF